MGTIVDTEPPFNIQTFTNFAQDSELSRSRCCIKVEVADGGDSRWKGEECETMLRGICEFNVDGEKHKDLFS